MKSATEMANEGLQSKQKSAYVQQLEQELSDTEVLLTSLDMNLRELREREVTGPGRESRAALIASLVKSQEEAHKIWIEVRQSLAVFAS